ncbi:hypothetical protein E3P96_01131 [Wallemia ichthyophaga]|nr:hypothetical protein E3P96_01131 [Wallemia ichthyophaga]
MSSNTKQDNQPEHGTPPHSPSSARSSLRRLNDEDRQRQQDIDSVMQLSRARAGSFIQHTPSYSKRPRNETLLNADNPEDDGGLSPSSEKPQFLFPLSADEEAQIELAKQGGSLELDNQDISGRFTPQSSDLEIEKPPTRPSPLSAQPSTDAIGSGTRLKPNKFDFSLLDAYVAAESTGLELSERAHSGLTPPSTPKQTDDEKKEPMHQRHLAIFDSSGAPPPTFPSGSSPPPPPPSNDPYNNAPRPSLPPRIPTTAEKDYRFSFYSNSLPATVHARSLGELPSLGQSFQQLFEGKQSTTSNDKLDENALELNIGVENGNETPVDDSEANTWWLDVLSPTDSEMRTLSKVFGIHPLTTEDIQMEESREKIELFRNYYLVCFRSFDQDPHSPTYLEPLNMYIIVFREGTLSFHFRATPHPHNVRRRIKQLRDYINVTSDWISYALIDDITDAFAPLIQSIEFEVDTIDELVLILKENEQSDMLRRIGTCRKKVMGLLRLMGNKADVVKGLAKRCNENWTVAPKSDIGLYLSDIQDHLITMTQNLNHYEKILSRSHSNYLAQISIEMTEANNQINNVLSKLTALGTVLVPINIVCGLWGMNVHVPGESADGLNWFFAILGILVGVCIIVGTLTYWLALKPPKSKH